MTIRGYLSHFSCFVEHEQASFVINKKASHAKFSSSLDLFYSSHDLLLSTQAIAYALSFFGFRRSRSICCSTRADSKDKLRLMLLSQLDHLLYFTIEQGHYPFGLGYSMDRNTILLELL